MQQVYSLFVDVKRSAQFLMECPRNADLLRQSHMGKPRTDLSRALLASRHKPTRPRVTARDRYQQEFMFSEVHEEAHGSKHILVTSPPGRWHETSWMDKRRALLTMASSACGSPQDAATTCLVRGRMPRCPRQRCGARMLSG